MITKPSERGQMLVLVVFSIVALIGITALAVDGGNAFADRREAQNAADSAAMASALSRIRGTNFVEQAYKAAAQNGYDNNGNSNSVQVFSPPISGEHVDDIEYIQVIITSRVDTFFGGIIGRDFIINEVSAVSRTQTPEIMQLLKGNAVVSLAPTSDCDNNKAFWVHGEATLDITGGGVFVNSNNRECAFIEQGSGSIRIRDDSLITIVGGASIQKPKLLTPYPPKTGSVPVPYPPPFFLPKVGCEKEAVIIEETPLDETEEGTKEEPESVPTPDEETGLTMSAGSWGGDFPPEDVTYLQSGTYCVDEFIITNDLLVGNGVTILVENGKVQWNANATIQLSAPTTGPYAGLLLYLPMDNRKKVQLNAGGDSIIKGTILAPGSEIIFKGNSSKYGFHSQIIGYRINADGQDNIIIKYLDEQNYDAMTMPEIELAE